jgi:hypothetical protein
MMINAVYIIFFKKSRLHTTIEFVFFPLFKHRMNWMERETFPNNRTRGGLYSFYTGPITGGEG